MSSNYSPETFPYIIQADDTIWDLADQYDTTVEDIMAANPGVDPDNLYIGQVIYVPGDPPSTWVDDPVESFQRRPQRRRRPPYRPAPPYRYRPPVTCYRGRYYTVQPGDNLYRIARRFGVSTGEIIARNPNINPYYLQVGQVICVPFR
jgi:peptidoglycan endopeptidase LytF